MSSSTHSNGHGNGPPAGVAPPHSIEAEQAVLGAMLQSDRTHYAYIIEAELREHDFYRERHRTVFESMLALFNAGEPIDVLTVTEHLRSRGKLDEAGGPGEIDALTAAAPSVGSLRQYGRIVKDRSLMRRLLTATYEIQAGVHGHEGEPRELVERAERTILEVAHDDRQKEFRRVGEVLHTEIGKWQKLSAEGQSLTGTPSGFGDLDVITGGFQPGNLIVIAARPSMGKSALVTNIAENVALHKERPRPVALFSLEMSEAELAQRFIASQASIKGDDLRKGRLKDETKWKRVLRVAADYDAAPLFVDDSSDIGILDVRAKARRLHQQSDSGLGLIIVDYLQLMRADTRIENRVQQVGEMSRGLKILARELEVPVIALSQLSRGVESRTDKRPMLSDLRECVTGDTLVVLADGRRVPIRDLVGAQPEVVSVDDRDRVVRARSDKVWKVGRREVFAMRLASGRALRATAEHRVRAAAGWRTLSDLAPGDRIALARSLPGRASIDVDTVPPYGRSAIGDAPAGLVVTHRAPAAVRGAGVGGGARVVFAPPRVVVADRGSLVAELTPEPGPALAAEPALAAAAETDVVWDRVVRIDPGGFEDVYDLTVPGPANWLADGIVTHNSGQIEQDADLVIFIYRDEYYHPETTEHPGEAELIISKHRNGGLGDVPLTFQNEYPRFLGLQRTAA